MLNPYFWLMMFWAFVFYLSGMWIVSIPFGLIGFYILLED